MKSQVLYTVCDVILLVRLQEKFEIDHSLHDHLELDTVTNMVTNVSNHGRSKSVHKGRVQSRHCEILTSA